MTARSLDLQFEGTFGYIRQMGVLVVSCPAESSVLASGTDDAMGI